MDDLRRSPPPFPPLAVRERGNYISVRQASNQDGGWGTLNRPKRIDIPRLGQVQLHTRLGYEAMPSSEVWAFQVSYPLQLQVNRLSEDRMANCVAVALLDGENRHVAPLVATARGVGQPVRIPAGSYKIIASLGIAEDVTVEIEVNAAPPVGVAGRVPMVLEAFGSLLSATRKGLVGLGAAAGGGRGVLSVFGRALAGSAAATSGGLLKLQSQMLVGSAVQGVAATGRLDLRPPTQLQGTGMVSAAGRGRSSPIVWLTEPDNAWRARRNGLILELNRAYFATDPALQRQQLLEAGL